MLRTPSNIISRQVKARFNNAIRRDFSSSNWNKNQGQLEQKQNRIVLGLIGVNTLVYLAWNSSDPALERFLQKNFTISSYGILKQQLYHTMVTSIFSHKDFDHILFNMLGLFTFGMQSIHALGTPKFLILYFGGGMVSSICQAMAPYITPDFFPASRKLSNPHNYSLGASGAINSIVAWSILTSPKAIYRLYGVIPIPAATFGLLYLGVDAYGLYAGNTNIGNAAHLGGAAFGATMFFAFKRLRIGRF